MAGGIKFPASREADGKFYPRGAWAEEQARKVPEGKPVILTVWRARNPLHHAKLFALADIVASNDPKDEFKDGSDAVNWAKLHVPSMWKSFTMHDATMVIQPKSINWASMDQAAFEKFYDRAVELWSERLGITVDELLAEPR